ncbi:MAG: dUTP diphosphatase [archaeon]
MLKIKIKKLKKEAVIPKYALKGDAGMDVVAITKNETDKFVEYGTGLAFEIPLGYACLIFPRGSVSNKDLILSNCVGVLDSEYRGELRLRFKKVGKESYNIGDKIGQIIILPFPKIFFEEVKELGSTQRGKNGFGSSGN